MSKNILRAGSKVIVPSGKIGVVYVDEKDGLVVVRVSGVDYWSGDVSELKEYKGIRAGGGQFSLRT